MRNLVYIKILTSISVFLILVSFNAHAQCTHPDYNGLMELYDALNGPQWKDRDDWHNAKAGTFCDLCALEGVVCSDDRIIEISLNDISELNGNIPDLKLEELLRLFIVRAQFSDTDTLSDFSGNLVELEIVQSELNGTIPNFTKLPNLKNLVLSSNNLIGQIPNFQNMMLLEEFRVSDNNMSGTIPDFALAPKLQSISLSNNNITGPIPDFGQTHNLRTLLLSRNNLSGCFPEFICNLNFFSAGDNTYLPYEGDHDIYCASADRDLVGAFCGGEEFGGWGEILEDCSCGIYICPDVVPDFDALMQLYTDTNGPLWFNNHGWRDAAEGLQCDPCHPHPVQGPWYGIKCDSNGRVSQIDLDGLDDGETRNLEGNNLSGTWPDIQLPFLQTLILTGNDIVGPVPDINEFPHLKKFGGSFNAFSGSISELKNNPDLEEYRCSYNALTGSIPDLSQNPVLTKFVVSNNSLEGCLPENACSFEVFSTNSNHAMPWEGDHENYCLGDKESGAPCVTMDNIPGVINENCDCVLSSSTDTKNVQHIVLYPSPVKDVLNIKSSHKIIAYQIYDFKGRLIKDVSNPTLKINTTPLKNGLYLLQLMNEKGQITINRFVKI